MEFIFGIILTLFIIGGVVGVWGKTKPSKPYRPTPPPATPDLSDPGTQLKAVMQAPQFTTQAVLNRSEKDIYWALVRHMDSKRFSVCPQVNMGEFLGNRDNDAFFSINSKRVDFCIVDRNWQPVAVVEYDGSGHYLDEAAGQRNAVKKLALQSAGVPCYAFAGGDVEGFLRQHLGQLRTAA